MTGLDAGMWLLCGEGSRRKPQNSLQEMPVRTQLLGRGGRSLRVPVGFN